MPHCLEIQSVGLLNMIFYLSIYLDKYTNLSWWSPRLTSTVDKMMNKEKKTLDLHLRASMPGERRNFCSLPCTHTDIQSGYTTIHSLCICRRKPSPWSPLTATFTAPPSCRISGAKHASNNCRSPRFVTSNCTPIKNTICKTTSQLLINVSVKKTINQS